MTSTTQISVAIVSHSVAGSTKSLAQSVAQGVNSVDGAQAINMAIEMGGPTAQFKAFADASSDQWEDQQWANKLAAGFTIGANYSGDQHATIQYLITLAGQHGMIWVGVDSPGGDVGVPNRLGAQGGVIAQSPDGKIHEHDAELAQYLGCRVASLACQFKRGGAA